MGAKEFFTAIDMLETYNEIMNITEKPDEKRPVRLTTRELGKYRSYLYREKMLRREILLLTNSRMRIEKLLKQGSVVNSALAADSYKRGRSKMIDLWLALSQVVLKRREIEKQYEQIPDPLVRKVVLHRYLSDENTRLHTWAQTACELGLPMTGVQLRKTVVTALGL